MTRRTALVRALAALGGATLLWSAWRVLSTDLSTTGRILASILWLLLAAAVVTFVLYARELVRHAVELRGGNHWQPVPSVALLWVGGAASLVVFAALMPAGAAPAPEDTVAKTSTRSGDSAADAGDAAGGGSATSATTAPSSPTAASRTRQRTPAPATTSSTTSQVATQQPQPVTTTAPAPASTTSSRTKPKPKPATTSTTSTPLLDITLPGHGKPTTPPPGH